MGSFAFSRPPSNITFQAPSPPLTPHHTTPHHTTPSPPGPLRNGDTPTAFQSMCLGSGHSISIPQYSTESLYCLVLGAPVSHSQLNTDKVSVWENGVGCIWKQAGVWGYNAQGEPILENPHYFAKADFGREHYVPFSKKLGVALRQHLPDVSIFVEMPPHDLHLASFPDISPEDIPNAVNASHWVCSVMLYIFTFVSGRFFRMFLGKLNTTFPYDLFLPVRQHNVVFGSVLRVIQHQYCDKVSCYRQNKHQEYDGVTTLQHKGKSTPIHFRLHDSLSRRYSPLKPSSPNPNPNPNPGMVDGQNGGSPNCHWRVWYSVQHASSIRL
jgi:hypothetical protein